MYCSVTVYKSDVSVTDEVAVCVYLHQMYATSQPVQSQHMPYMTPPAQAQPHAPSNPNFAFQPAPASSCAPADSR